MKVTGVCNIIAGDVLTRRGAGEGGTFALFQGIYPPAEKDFDADRTLTGDSSKVPQKKGKLTQKLRWPLLIWVRVHDRQDRGYAAPLTQDAGSLWNGADAV